MASVTIPYTNDFEVGASDFTTDGGTWTVVDDGSGSNNVYQHSAVGVGNTNNLAAVQTSDLAGDTDFTLSTQFTVTDWVGGSSPSFGLISLATIYTDTTPDSYLLTDVAKDGSLRIGYYNTAGAFTTSASQAGTALALDTLYTLTLDASYQISGDLDLSFTITGGSLNETLSTTIADANVLSGDLFGYRVRQNSTTTVEFDNFSATAVPEPSAYALISGLLGLGFIITRRRRR